MKNPFYRLTFLHTMLIIDRSGYAFPSDRGTEQGRALRWCGTSLPLPLPAESMGMEKNELLFIFGVHLAFSMYP